MQQFREDIRNIAIVAHVDHGKTSLVDALLKQSKVFRENQQVGELIMDRNALEREKGITILAKNTAIMYRGVKINIIDTPGHADFSGEVERVVNMADGCLLLVDSVEGPMPQTRFVLRQAFEKGLRPIVVINKIDRENARIAEVVSLTQDLFLELATTSEQLDFPVLYTSARNGTCTTDPAVEGTDMVPLFEAILMSVPPPAIDEGPFQMMVSNLDYDNYKGRFAIGRVLRGSIKPKDIVAVIGADGNPQKYEIDDVFTFMGLTRSSVEEASAGEIVSITGLETVSIGDTVVDPEHPDALPRIVIGEPTVKMTFGVNGSPFAGREGKYCTSRQLRERLYRELEVNISLRVQDTDSPDLFLVSGRGELHLAILVETMRRQDYEFEISRPEAITHEENGKVMEPVEQLILDTREDYIGVITEMAAKRQGKMTDMHNDGKGNLRMEYKIPTRGLIGFRSAFLTATRGEGVVNTIFLGFEPYAGEIVSARSGTLVAAEAGVAVTYGLNNAQERGITFIDPGTQVYEGMIVGLNSRPTDLAVNVCKEKKMTNIRSSTSDIAVRLTPALKFSLEESMDFIASDELVEITPKNIRLRKRLLTMNERARSKKAGERAGERAG
ncbi:MAG: translational GTPase TypA [Chloroflexi bacterium]|nr:translational GTPase TypA [Chloroflexota bacterium]